MAGAHYRLYRIYLEKEAGSWVDLMGGSGSKTYADIILERWPDSEFARLVRDPNILQADEVRRKEEEAAYKEVYQLFRSYAYYPVITACDHVLLEEPRNHFHPNYHILKAMALGRPRSLAWIPSALRHVHAQRTRARQAHAPE